jgi:multidrug efflux pump subunit AcrA (membrane-fusion protein)
MTAKNITDRIIQIILLLLIAGGITVMISLNLKADNQEAGRGAPPGATSSSRPQTPAAGGDGQSPRQGSSTRNSIAVETYTVQKTDVSQYIKVNGDVTVETTVEIYSDTNGKLVSSMISLGDTIQKGELIASVDPSLPGQNYSISAVRSTIAGTVISLPLQVGAKVSTSTPIATIGDLEDLVILTYIPERFISALKEGLSADVSFDAFPDEVFQARISEINPVMDVNTRTLSVKLVLSRKDKRIRPGMFATMKLITRESKDTIAVPAQAVLSYYGESMVYVMDENDLAQRRIVEMGLISDEQIEIIKGLNVGDRVIVQGLNKLTEGTPVRQVEVNL